ncbi:hypothetical protein VP01_5669g1 [Puccinia sorghi]|uniref:Tc1-like transposase DDE domain-containing protein n=1 Tax=Puccinia sorghi TaxID=27349 RepID=A0A0L6UIW4_9BASI|nr:hypothetical protein VP01_5669g1 [Puccinia sorghi]
MSKLPGRQKVATLKTDARGSIINIIGAMYEKNGDILNQHFLLSFPSRSLSFQVNHYHGQSQDGWWGQVSAQNLVKESTKKINIEFLPKYSPFLNPIELSFNISKIEITHKEINSHSKLSEGIHQAISHKLTSGIGSKSFQHCQKFYSTHIQQITRKIIKDPENFVLFPSDNVS